MHDANSIERNIYASRNCGHGIGVPVDCLLVERIDLRNLGVAACRGDFCGDAVQLCDRAACKEDLRSLTSKDTRHRTADRTTASVDNGVLVVKQHCVFSSG